MSADRKPYIVRVLDRQSMPLEEVKEVHSSGLGAIRVFMVSGATCGLWFRVLLGGLWFRMLLGVLWFRVLLGGGTSRHAPPKVASTARHLAETYG